ncbi:GT-D fold domain-containing glycosyltransferase [Paenibacillus sp. TRM 82003]|nr:GT-D fold domain-containing glycosyltransferase [Paenibacillus sp. TRM 82003]
MPENTTDPLDGTQLMNEWEDAAKQGKPYASIRFAEAEALVGAHEEILTMKAIEKTAWGVLTDIRYTGVALPDALARIRLIEALREADTLGLLAQRDNWWWRPLADLVLQYYDIKPRALFYTFENLYLAKTEAFYRRFKPYRIALVGAKAEACAEVLERRYGWDQIVGTVHCPTSDTIDLAQAALEKLPFQIAFVSNSIPGKMLTAHAKRLGRVGVDIGSAAELWLQSDAEGVNAWEWAADRFPRRDWEG